MGKQNSGVVKENKDDAPDAKKILTTNHDGPCSFDDLSAIKPWEPGRLSIITTADLDNEQKLTAKARTRLERGGKDIDKMPRRQE